MADSTKRRGSEHGAFIIDRKETILAFDQEMERLTGWPSIDVVGHHKELALGGVRPISSAPLYEGHIPITPGSRNIELVLNCSDGRRLEVKAVADPLPGPGERMLVTALRVMSRSSAGSIVGGGNLDRRDELTGLPGPDAFARRLAADFADAAAAARPMAMVLADIDGLRDINDRLGRAAGDEVLEKLAGIFRVSIDDEERICRLADDDFAILLPNAGRGEARQVAASLRSIVEGYRFLQTVGDETPLRVTLSLGAASFPADADGEADLIERAREALDEARSMGRNRVWCYLRRPRVPVQVPVFFDGADALLVGYSRDLSPSGIFVQTASPIDIGMRCALAFPLPGYPAKVHVIARVVRTVPTETLFEESDIRIPGMGVEFERFGGANDRRAIEVFLHKHEATTLRPEIGPLSIA